jgi:hypothetical protein
VLDGAKTEIRLPGDDGKEPPAQRLNPADRDRKKNGSSPAKKSGNTHTARGDDTPATEKHIIGSHVLFSLSRGCLGIYPEF